MEKVSDEQMQQVLRDAKTIAVVGASSKPHRASNSITRMLIDLGYTVWPVNPTEDELFGVKVYDSIDALPGIPDIVDIFRRPDEAVELVRQAIDKDAKFLFLQEGVGHPDSQKLADEAGVPIVMDRCIYKELNRFGML